MINSLIVSLGKITADSAGKRESRYDCDLRNCNITTQQRHEMNETFADPPAGVGDLLNTSTQRVGHCVANLTHKSIDTPSKSVSNCDASVILTGGGTALVASVPVAFGVSVSVLIVACC